MKRPFFIVLTILASFAISAQDRPQERSQGQPHQAKRPKPIFLQPACDGKLASLLLSSFKEAISTSQRYELVPNLSDKGKMDAVIVVQMACGESHNAVSVGSIYGMAKCFGLAGC